MLSYIKGEKQDKGILRLDPEANIFVQKEDLRSLYHSSNIVRVIKSRKLRWTGHVARMEEYKNSFKNLTGIYRKETSPYRYLLITEEEKKNSPIRTTGTKIWRPGLKFPFIQVYFLYKYYR